jgi:hypothetical protein
VDSNSETILRNCRLGQVMLFLVRLQANCLCHGQLWSVVYFCFSRVYFKICHDEFPLFCLKEMAVLAAGVRATGEGNHPTLVLLYECMRGCSCAMQG